MAVNSREPWQWSLQEAVEALRLGETTPSALLIHAERRINDTDGVINALPQGLRAFERAMATASDIDAADESKPWYHLRGAPICVKDLTSVAGLPFTQGSLLFKDRIATVDDPLVTALKRAGAVIIAKSNTPEFGAGAQTYNAVFGTTVNPWDITKTCGGSSGGSAAALAAGQVWGATGTDLGGSLRIPASFCDIVGIRPTPGVVPEPRLPRSRPTTPQPQRPNDSLTPQPSQLNPELSFTPAQLAGIQLESPLRLVGPIGEQFSCHESLWEGAGIVHSVSGPMARNVADLALLLDAMLADPCPEEPPPPTPPPTSFLAATQPDMQAAVTGHVTQCTYSPDLGLGPGVAPVDPEVEEICRRGARAVAAALGANLIEDLSPDCSDARPIFRVLRACRSKAMGPMVLSTRGRQMVKEELQREVERGMHQTQEDIDVAKSGHASYLNRWRTFLNRYPLVMTPVVITPPFDANTTWLRSFMGTPMPEYIDWLILTYAVSLVPCPALSLPVGFTSSGLPVGLQLISSPGQDRVVVAAAAAYERNNLWAAMVPKQEMGRPASNL